MLPEKMLIEMQAEQRERDRQWQQSQKADDRRFQMKWWLVTAVLGPLIGAIITLFILNLWQK